MLDGLRRPYICTPSFFLNDNSNHLGLFPPVLRLVVLEHPVAALLIGGTAGPEFPANDPPPLL